MFEVGTTVTIDMKAFDKLVKDCKKLNKRHVKFGWIEPKMYPAASSNRGLYVAEVARRQEMGMAKSVGFAGVPRRPYFNQAVLKVKYTMGNEFKTLFNAVTHNGNIEVAMQPLIKRLEKTYHESVMQQNYKPLAPYTVENKGHAIQMVDSGYMIANYQVKAYRQSQDSIKE